MFTAVIALALLLKHSNIYYLAIYVNDTNIGQEVNPNPVKFSSTRLADPCPYG